MISFSLDRMELSQIVPADERILLTSCYSTGSQWTHCCCSLANKVKNIDRGKSGQKCLFSWGILPPDSLWFLGTPRVHILNGISIGSSVFCSAHARDNRHRDRPRHVCNNRPHFMLSALRCGLIIKSLITCPNYRFPDFDLPRHQFSVGRDRYMHHSGISDWMERTSLK